MLIGLANYLIVSIREQIHKIKAKGDFDFNFAIEKPMRSEEEAKGWAPSLDFGYNPDDEDEGGTDQDRKQRFFECFIKGYFEDNSVCINQKVEGHRLLDIWHWMNPPTSRTEVQIRKIFRICWLLNYVHLGGVIIVGVLLLRLNPFLMVLLVNYLFVKVVVSLVN